METAELFVRLILLLPLAGAVLLGTATLFFPGLAKQKTLLGSLATAAVAIPFVLAVLLFVGYHHGEPVVINYFTWLSAGPLQIDFAYRIDELSLLMTLIITGIGSLIHIYSIGYMHDDPGFSRFFAYLNLFIFAMLNLVLGDNLLVLFLGWEGVGLCSYLLIGFWYQDLKNSAAANKAFIVNRIGDFAFLLAMFLIYREIGGLDYATILAGGASMDQGVTNWIVFLLFIGATGKSAQIPLFVWLPDAMAGPTPVSALIHAATMVTSGLYLLARLSPIVLSAPTIMAIIGIGGALTAIMAATVAIAQNDIKKVLAYSTVSQLGFMFMAAGVGAFFVAIFHVLTHAFFKACLFLGSGSVIHAMHHVEHEVEHETGKHIDPQDMRTMGGLKKYMPSTRWTYLIATFAIAGFPLTAGFFSKDEILFKAFEYGYSGEAYAWFVWGVGIVTALLTAFYMMRSYMLTFEGEERWPKAETIHPHESPATMTVPLWILAGFSLLVGFIGIPPVFTALTGFESWIHHWLGAPYGGPVFEPEAIYKADHLVPVAIEWLLIALGAGIAIVGLFLGAKAYHNGNPAFDAKLSDKLGGLYETWQAKYRWDEFYDRAIVQPLMTFSSRGLKPFDEKILDGAVNGLARGTGGLAWLMRPIQSGYIHNYAVAIVLGVALVLALMLVG